ncbi:MULTISPECIES: DEAD/DEAH box helicase [unclassified Nocardioides]|uniref:DEAD/DEAH box helicase n=1 Tax=unclassified Nocardioides TaxID=2615069 RepID=UPI0007025DC7|nr:MULTISPECIES: DEAD/DEAH box helicase [unclassified Nocardioides]KRC57393.1 helicase [Nocardioides sp. Root79]KRC74239.1 helicase [Nocardioides sp. Root240]
MSFVPVTGPASFRAGEQGEALIEFTDGEPARRRVALPVRAALPVLSRAHTTDGAHPSVALLSGAALLGLRLVAAGKVAPASDERPGWRVDGLDARDHDAVRRLAAARAHDGLDLEAADRLVRQVLDAVADAMPRAAPAVPSRPSPAAADVLDDSGRAPEDFADRVRRRLAERTAREHEQAARSRRRAALPELVRISLRVEADEEELVAGSVRVVLQVHDERDPLHVCDAVALWTGTEEEHGFGSRARVHASIALRAAADVWPVLDRYLALSVPDQLALDGEEISSLLAAVGDLRAAGVDVHWPRSLGPELTTRAVLERQREKGEKGGKGELPLQDSPFSAEGLFAFSWQVALHGEPLTDEEMGELARAASPVIKLRGAWTIVDPTTAQRARKRLIRKATGAQALAAALTGTTDLPAQGDDEPASAQVVVGASVLKVREQVLAAATRDPLPEPPGLEATLRDYQRHGLTWLADLTGLGLGACLADDMGLGKTITLIALHLHRRVTGASRDQSTLVVCPASLLGNWEGEIRRFAPGVEVRRFHGGSRSLGDLDGGFVLTTYGTLRRDVATLAGVPWDLVVADEAQHVKNSRTSTARALRQLPTRARVALTGTPVENELTELWSILDWCVPGLLGSRLAFRRAWAAPIESGTEPTKARQFADLIGPFLLRRRKSDPGIAPELPPKTETDHLLGLTREQVVLYEAFVRDSMERIERADPESRRGLVLALLTGLKQICNHPAQFLKQSGAVRLAGRSEKLELLDELVATVLAEDGAVLVFTQYVAMARLIEQHLTTAGIPHQFLHGGTPVAEREAMVRRFQDAENGVPVFLLSLKAGGTGLNLTRADHVIHVDRWWNPAVEEQATDRAYRIGQTKPVQVHRMVTHGTIEERVAQLLTRKQQLADAVLGRGDAALTELSNEELRDLVTLRRQARESAEAHDADAVAGA